MKVVQQCLICNSSDFEFFLDCKDYTVSNSTFQLQSCKKCGFVLTSPRPHDQDLVNYYKSEEYVSHSNTKRGLVNKLYHIIKNYTLIKKLRLVYRINGKQGKILDYGCGTAAFLNTCKKGKWTIYGFEPDAGARKHAVEDYQINLFSEAISIKSQLNNGDLDVITLWHVLEHVSDVRDVLKIFGEKLRAKGALIIAVPNKDSYDAQYYKSYWAAFDVPRHLHHFSPTTIETLLRSEGFKLEEVLPMAFDSFYVSMLSEKYKTGRINLLRAFWIGLYSNFKAIKSGKKYSSQIYVFRKA
jgi:2-polyprenyl-3-methyl-5-hydroxy-6-metoxy-1,4-benzoquinol methylase